MALVANNLSLSYRAASSTAGSVIKEVDLRIEAGEILVLQGPNGSGKSTLMKALARHLRPATGRVLLDDRDIWQIPVGEFARQLAYVPQSLITPAAMTVYDLVCLGRSPHQKIFQLSPGENDQRVVREAMEKCGVKHLQHKLVSELSGGERQRSVIAMAVAQEPAYLLLDEPTASLDFRYQLELVELLKNLKAQGLGIALILHDLNIAASLADTIALVAQAREVGQASTIAAVGPVESVFAPAILNSVFAVDIEIFKSESGEKSVYLPVKQKSYQP